MESISSNKKLEPHLHPSQAGANNPFPLNRGNVAALSSPFNDLFTSVSPDICIHQSETTALSTLQKQPALSTLQKLPALPKQSIRQDVDSVDNPAKRPKLQISQGQLTFPRSHFIGWQPPLPIIPERQAINELSVFWNTEDHFQDEFNIWTLESFSIYNSKNANELMPLHLFMINDRKGINELLFDGVITVHGEKRFVSGVLFERVTVDGYGTDEETISICIQSHLGEKTNVWYELGSPATEYASYYEPYIWIARLGRYFVEYMTVTEAVTLTLFRRPFFNFIADKYIFSKGFHAWSSQYPSQDYRQAICANVAYLRKECYGLDKELFRHPVWGEIDYVSLNAIPSKPPKHEKTIVTPFVLESFRNIAFASQLEVMYSPNADSTRYERRKELGLTPINCEPTKAPTYLQYNIGEVRRGDVVCVDADTDTQWKTSKGAKWYAYVQGTCIMKNGSQKLDVIWLYEPSDTTLGAGYYPWKNELFFSDNCSCGHEALDAADVRSKVEVQWFVTDPGAQTTFFVRKKFRTEHSVGAYDFVQLKEQDFRCPCFRSRSEMERLQEDFIVGDTVLVRETIQTVDGEKDEILEPAKIMEFSTRFVTLRKFHRCRRDLGHTNARPNEIAPTADFYTAGPEKIVRRCKITVFSSIQDLQPPYDRSGAGDFWFVIDPSAMGPNARDSNVRLKGMGIFCGGGSFDRGLEEGGGVTFRWGLDWDQHALHTYRANLENPDQMHLFLGSVNDYLGKAIHGTSTDSRIAGVGEVEVLAAGSPCPGFSKLQRHKESDQSLRNCSLVASVCAYVDHYMPLYLILENVLGMADNPTNAKEQNVFSQTLCCLVAMGYQVQQFLMDPGQFGSCQSRSRIFIVATAPGLTPLVMPPQTHSCPQLEKSSRSIGRSSNGLPFGKRKNDVCPFPFMSAEGALHDLPNISDAHIQACIQFPDHRTSKGVNLEQRALISMIPRWPHGQGYIQALHAGRLSKPQKEMYSSASKCRTDTTSKVWSRVYPDRLVGCLTTICQPHDAFNGRVIHWDQPRLLTVMEARRIQGIPDDEVVIGRPSQQWRIIGNGVDRKVAFAIGLSLAEAWGKKEKQSVPESVMLMTPGSSTTGPSIISFEDVPQSSPRQRLTNDFLEVLSESRSVVAGSVSDRIVSTQSVLEGESVVESEESDMVLEQHQVRNRVGARRSLRGSSERLMVPLNFAKRPERARTTFL